MVRIFLVLTSILANSAVAHWSAHAEYRTTLTAQTFIAVIIF